RSGWASGRRRTSPSAASVTGSLYGRGSYTATRPSLTVSRPASSSSATTAPARPQPRTSPLTTDFPVYSSCPIRNSSSASGRGRMVFLGHPRAGPGRTPAGVRRRLDALFAGERYWMTALRFNGCDARMPHDRTEPPLRCPASASSATTYIESSAGIADGARTGLASLVTGALFLVAMLLTPLATLVPSEAAGPALVV